MEERALRVHQVQGRRAVVEAAAASVRDKKKDPLADVGRGKGRKQREKEAMERAKEQEQADKEARKRQAEAELSKPPPVDCT